MQENLNISGIRFSQKKESVPYRNRLTYKVAIIALILNRCCRGRGCSLVKFQIIMNYLHSKESQERLIDFINNKQSFVYLRYDSTVVKAIEYMNSEGLIEMQNNGSFRLTEKGQHFAIEVWEDEEVFIFEKLFLKQLGNSLTEIIVSNIKNNLFAI